AAIVGDALVSLQELAVEEVCGGADGVNDRRELRVGNGVTLAGYDAGHRPFGDIEVHPGAVAFDLDGLGLLQDDVGGDAVETLDFLAVEAEDLVAVLEADVAAEAI